jgi:hypothetical protein
MSQSEREDQGTLAGQGTAKKAYVKPEFRHEKVFETMALTCGKVGGTQGPCNSVRRTS